MRKGIVRDFVWSCIAGLGHVAIEDCETHAIDMMLYDKRLAIDKHKGREVYWECDQAGMLTRVELIRHS